METSEAKQTLVCDNCKQSLDDGVGVQADFTEKKKKGDTKPPKKDLRHYCDPECLRLHLNKLHKAEASKASLQELDLLKFVEE